MQFNALLLSTFAGAAAALFTPDTSKPPSGNTITAPVNAIVPAGKPYTITWTPSTTGKVSIVFLKGPATNVVYDSTIADSIDNTGSFVWNVPASIVPATSGYAVEIIADDHTYQYSTQIGIASDEDSHAADPNSVTAAASTTFGSVETAPPSGTTFATAVCGALDECASAAASTTFGSVETAPPAGTTFATAVCGALDECASTTAAASSSTTVAQAAVTGTGNVSSPIVSPTVPISMPTGLATVAAPPAQTLTSNVFVGTTAAATASSALSTGFATSGPQLSGAAALAAGLLGLLAL